MATFSQWVQGSRPRTWPAALAPVAAGSGAAVQMLSARGEGIDVGHVLSRALIALGVALALQIGVNYANDYSDGVRGTDDDRVGPFRLTGSGAARPAAVKRAAVLALGIGGGLGVLLTVLAGAWWMLLVGAAAILAAWFYTGGSRPYGYLGLGEVFVFVFFGLVAVLGTTFAIAGGVSGIAVLAACAIGLLAVAVLVTNNLRDIPSDTVAGKTTLAVRLGDRRARWLYAACMIVPFVLMIPVIAAHLPAVIVLAAAGLAVAPVRSVLAGATGRGLIPVLGTTGRVELVFSVLLLLGLAI